MDYPSIWQEEKAPQPFAGQTGLQKNESKTYETVIVGAGLCGLLTAYRLVEKGVHSIAVVDAGELAGGVTARTTAKITSQHGLIYDRLLQGLGREKAWAYAQANQEAVEAFAALAELFPCDFRRCGSVVYAAEEKDAEQVERELQAALRVGLPAAPMRGQPLPFPVAAGVRFENQARFHPLKFAYALAACLAPKVDFYLHTTALHPRKGGVDGVLHTTAGTLHADNVVVATHFPFMDKPGFYFARVWQERSYVLAIRNVPALEDLYWGAGEKGWSFRPCEGGLLVGGGSHKSGHEGRQAHFDRLEAATKSWYPQREVTAQWSAQDCMTHDGIPYIGRYKQLDGQLAARAFVATGFNKWGMTGSMVAADLISSEIAGRESPYAEVFSPSRFDPGMKAKRFIMENTDMLKNYIGGYMELPPETAASLKPGEGRILQVDGQRVGAYKDTDGTIYTVKPVCTHMGCILEWNQDECSWDCPCHGSRYDVTGKILNNPALEPLGKTTLGEEQGK